MDPLSDVIRAVRLNGAYFYFVEAASPWSVCTVAARELVPRVLPDAEHLIPYHILVTGSCWGGLEDEEQVQMKPGDVIVFPHGEPHVMSSMKWRGRRDGTGVLTESQRYADTVFLGPSGTRDTTFVCGFLGCDLRPFNPLLASLPRRLYVPGITSGWLSQFPAQAVAESRIGRVGHLTMLTRMAELMFIEAVRYYLEHHTSAHHGWLAGLVDSIVGPALTHLHERPDHPWTLAELARASGSSRTVLAERFTRVVGVSPMLYLRRWRLQLAANQLYRSPAKVATIASQAGYESEAAFSRAFKQETGLAPALWRRARQQG
ncbi:MAG TPA: AraC family transcriptional regulator [Gemmatimonadaceae bacterium]|nr:AraC family transcriptional regulator [Gemmatimonadaceae bacterium]